MAKPQPVRVPSDDCVVTVKGTSYHVHEGEWVELLPGLSVGDYESFHAFAGVQVQMAAVKGEADEGLKTIGILADTFGKAVPLVKSRLVAWNWTDMRGEPLPQPHAEPSPLWRLDEAEIAYLIQVITGTNEAAEKNASSPSETTSSDTAPLLTPIA